MTRSAHSRLHPEFDTRVMALDMLEMAAGNTELDRLRGIAARLTARVVELRERLDETVMVEHDLEDAESAGASLAALMEAPPQRSSWARARAGRIAGSFRAGGGGPSLTMECPPAVDADGNFVLARWNAITCGDRNWP